MASKRNINPIVRPAISAVRPLISSRLVLEGSARAVIAEVKVTRVPLIEVVTVVNDVVDSRDGLEDDDSKPSVEKFTSSEDLGTNGVGRDSEDGGGGENTLEVSEGIGVNDSEGNGGG